MMKKNGTPIERAFVCVLSDGAVCVDWGDGRFQDVETGQFRPISDDPLAHTATDGELDALVRQGGATGYDAQYAYLLALPDPKRDTLD
jgi:hypothetical protein